MNDPLTIEEFKQVLTVPKAVLLTADEPFILHNLAQYLYEPEPDHDHWSWQNLFLIPYYEFLPAFHHATDAALLSELPAIHIHGMSFYTTLKMHGYEKPFRLTPTGVGTFLCLYAIFGDEELIQYGQRVNECIPNTARVLRPPCIVPCKC